MENPKPMQNQPEEAQDLLAKPRAQKKKLTIAGIAVVVVLIGALATFFIVRSGSAKADELAGKAYIAAANINPADSVAQDSVLQLFLTAADAGYKSGNIAKLEAAIIYYRQGKNQEALALLDDASIKDDIIAAGAKTLQGDCYANLENYDEAVKCFDKAVDKAGNNPQIVPFILVKKANVLRAKKDYAAEAEALKTIVEKYPRYSDMHGIERYYERAAALAAK